MLSFPRWLGDGGTRAISDRLLDAGLVLAPSTCFEAGERHFRFGMGKRNFPDALARLEACLDELTG